MTRVLKLPFVGVWKLCCLIQAKIMGVAGRIADAWQALEQSQQEDVVTWFWFSLVLGALPVIFSLLARLVTDSYGHPLRQGDLYLLGALLCFIGVGEMFRAERKDKQRGVSFMNRGGGTALIGVIDALMYAVVSGTQHPHSLGVNLSSIVLYIVSAGCSLACILEAGR